MAVVPWVAEEEVEEDNLLRFDLNSYTIKKLSEKDFHSAWYKKYSLFFIQMAAYQKYSYLLHKHIYHLSFQIDSYNSRY